jgi:uncharacterized protein (DUF1697 family)
MVRSGTEVASVIEHAETSRMPHGGGITLYVGFLKTLPGRAAVRAVTGLSNEVDQLSIVGQELFWQCRKPFAESTITGASVEALLETPVTIRNFNTVRKLADRTSTIRLS